VIAIQKAVVRGEDDDRIVQLSGALQGVDNPFNEIVDRLQRQQLGPVILRESFLGVGFKLLATDDQTRAACRFR
jgi:hypothetical protein